MISYAQRRDSAGKATVDDFVYVYLVTTHNKKLSTPVMESANILSVFVFLT